MAKLNFYDTDAVKAFVLDILIENAELKSDLDYEKKCSNDWFDRYKKADQQVKDLEAKVATLEGGSENADLSVCIPGKRRLFPVV